MFALAILSLVGLSSASYAATCDVFPTNTCSTSVASVSTGTTSAGDKTAVAAVSMSGYQRLDVFARVCDPSGWALHMADSPTTNGWGGDAGTTDHDAEAYIYDGDGFQFYGAYDFNRAAYPSITAVNHAINPDSLDADGCGVVQMAFVNASSTSAATSVLFDGDATDAYDAPEIQVNSMYGPRLGYTSTTSSTVTTRSIETDYEDRASLADRYKWYVGVNRTVGSPSRFGSGVEEACIVQSTTTAEPASCL